MNHEPDEGRRRVRVEGAVPAKLAGSGGTIRASSGPAAGYPLNEGLLSV